MENLEKFYINGRWVTPNSTETMPVSNPATEQKIGHITLGNGTDVDRAVTAALTAFEEFSQTSKAQRLSLLLRLKSVTEARFEDLAQAMRLEMGAPISMARSDQADAAVGHLQGFIDALEKLEEQITLASGDVLVREPIGVCGLITPWNWPMNQIVLKVVPALATGSCCILKPSEHTPISAMIYAEPTHPSRMEEIKPEPEIVRIADLINAIDEKPETPRLAVIRETPTPADSQDGITARAKVPSWDEIMFGRKSEEPTEDN